VPQDYAKAREWYEKAAAHGDARRKNGAGFATLESWLADFDILFLRRNHADPLVLLPWRIWRSPLQRT
jgi:TPR repeat protein